MGKLTKQAYDADGRLIRSADRYPMAGVL
nr:hypothetical protein [Methylomonas sp. MK1]